jgi:hypothetical protein
MFHTREVIDVPPRWGDVDLEGVVVLGDSIDVSKTGGAGHGSSCGATATEPGRPGHLPVSAVCVVPQRRARGPKGQTRGTKPRDWSHHGKTNLEALCRGCCVCRARGVSAQQNSSYTGQPLAVLNGTVTTAGTGQPPALEVALGWLGAAVGVPFGGTPIPLNQPEISPVAVSGQFPSAFTLDLMTPPPDDDLIPCPNPPTGGDDEGPEPGHFGFAGIAAIPPGADGGENDLSLPVYGEAFEFRVVYVDQDITSCDWLSQFVVPVLTKGYHLVQRIPGPCPATNIDCAPFSEVPLTTTIELPIQSTPLAFAPSVNNVVAGLTAGPNCVQPEPDPLPWDPSTGSPCQLFLQADEGPAAPIDCSGPGLTLATPLQSAELSQEFPQINNICEVAQIPPSAWVDGSCAQSSQAGWCYVTGPAAGSCANGAIFFSPSALPPQGDGAPLLGGQFICP